MASKEHTTTHSVEHESIKGNNEKNKEVPMCYIQTFNFSPLIEQRGVQLERPVRGFRTIYLSHHGVSFMSPRLWSMEAGRKGSYSKKVHIQIQEEKQQQQEKGSTPHQSSHKPDGISNQSLLNQMSSFVPKFGVTTTYSNTAHGGHNECSDKFTKFFIQQSTAPRPEVAVINAFLEGADRKVSEQSRYFYEPLQLLRERRDSVMSLNFGTTDTNKIRAGKERDLADVHLVGLPKSDAIQVTGLVYELDNTVPYCDRKPAGSPVRTNLELTNVHAVKDTFPTDEYVCHRSGRAPSLSNGTQWFSSPGFIVQRPQRVVNQRHKDEYEGEKKRERIFA